MIQSVYIHIPFCQQLCHYCDFTKFFYDEQLANDYMVALEQEINTAIEGNQQKVRTIFIGGGTPTALNHQQLKKLMEMIHHKFDVDHVLEFTIEANPGDFDEEKIKLLRAYGVNRISLGVQVFNNDMLKELGRIHNVDDVYTTIHLLRKNGFSNISIDLIYALPHQTVADFRDTLEKAVELDLPHYSTYALQIEPKTVFYQRYRKGKLHRPPQEDEVKMYQCLREIMAKNNVRQYEISNFAKEGFESQHNLTYWNNDHYYGFGAGASGYLPGKRTINIRPLPHYVKKAMSDGKPILHIDEIGQKEMIEEEMFLGLRRLAGVNKSLFQQKFGFQIEQLYQSELDKLIQRGLLMDNGESVCLTDEGLLLGNEVFAAFLLDSLPSNR